VAKTALLKILKRAKYRKNTTFASSYKDINMKNDKKKTVHIATLSEINTIKGLYCNKHFLCSASHIGKGRYCMGMVPEIYLDKIKVPGVNIAASVLTKRLFRRLKHLPNGEYSFHLTADGKVCNLQLINLL